MKSATNATTYRTQSVIYEGHRFLLIPVMTLRDWIKSNSFVWNVKGWFKSSTFEFVSLFQSGFEDYNSHVVYLLEATDLEEFHLASYGG